MADFVFHVDPRAVADPGDEHGIQVRLLNRLRMVAPRIKVLAIPNQALRSAAGHMRMKAEGLARGVPDLCAMADGQVAWMELKDSKGSLAPAQVDFANWLVRNGFRYGCYRSVASAEAALRSWGFPFIEEACDAA